MFHIKIREKGKKAWYFLTSRGGMNRLRVHAATFKDEAAAQAVIDENKADNPEFEWKVSK